VRAAPADDLLALLAETNDLRRDVGRALVGLHRALVLWKDRGKGLFAIVRGFAPGATQLMERSEARIRRLFPHQRDDRLRRWIAPFLKTLADDLEAGDLRLAVLLRTLEGRFPELTAMMRAQGRADPLHDLEAARDLRRAFASCARADRAFVASSLRAAAADLVARQPA